ncbi:MAG: DoxX family protein [bacterium]|nr:DoxX family protein [bacterium]
MQFFTMLHSYSDFGLVALRVAIGAIFLAHGIMKLKGDKTPPGFKVLGGFEVLGAVAVLAGFMTQLATLGLSIIMIGAIYMKVAKWKSPFASIEKNGWEFDLMILAGTLMLYFVGAGSFLSLDRIFFGL